MDIANLVGKVQDLLNGLLPLLISVGVIFFVFGVIRYFIADSEEAKSKGRDQIVYGIIGFAVILSLWGLVAIITSTLGIDSATAPQLTELTVGQNASNAGAGCSARIEGNPKLQDFLGYVTCLINSSVIPFIFALAVVMFLWGAVNFFILNSDEEAKRAQGRQFMLWGIIALAVMLSVWGLVGIVRSTVFGDRGNGSVLPQVCPPGACKENR